MYKPIQPGIPHTLKSEVLYEEVIPSREYADVVQCFWTLSTYQELKESFEYIVLPDGCVDIVFDIGDRPGFDGVLIMTPNLTAERLQLGKSFSYVGIRFRPGVWLTSVESIVGRLVELNKLAGSDFRQIRERLAVLHASERTKILEQLAASLEQQGVIGKGLFMHLASTPQVFTVEDLISATGYSRRQLQRRFRELTGYRPHDFIKVVRFQQALIYKNFDAFYDQSHFTRECKRITGMTPHTFQAAYL